VQESEEPMYLMQSGIPIIPESFDSACESDKSDIANPTPDPEIQGVIQIQYDLSGSMLNSATEVVPLDQELSALRSDLEDDCEIFKTLELRLSESGPQSVNGIEESVETLNISQNESLSVSNKSPSDPTAHDDEHPSNSDSLVPARVPLSNTDPESSASSENLDTNTKLPKVAIAEESLPFINENSQLQKPEPDIENATSESNSVNTVNSSLTDLKLTD